MKTRMMMLAVLLSSVAQAAGFQLDMGGARGTGLGNSMVAFIDDASSLYYNPSGLAGRKGFDVSLGVALVIPSITFKSDNTGASTASSSLGTPINAYLAYGITDNLSIGVGLFNPFAAAVNWPTGWEGEGLALSSSLQTFDINPSIAYAPHPRLKLAAGFQAVRGTVAISRALQFVDSTGSVSLAGDSWGYGWNAGFQVEVIEQTFFIGGNYRSGVQMDFKGRAHFSNIPLGFQSLLKDQAITSSVYLPETAAFGIAVKPMTSLRLAAAVNVTTWGTFHDLTINFTDAALTNPLHKNWDSNASVSVGGEYDVSQAIAVRLGFVWDPTPSPAYTLTPDLPDANRFKIAVGAGWNSSFGLGVDLGYQLVILSSQRSNAPGFSGSYSGLANVVALNLNYHL